MQPLLQWHPRWSDCAPLAARRSGCRSGPTRCPGAWVSSSTLARFSFSLLQPGLCLLWPCLECSSLRCPHGSLPHFFGVWVPISDTAPGPHLKLAPSIPARLPSASSFSPASTILRCILAFARCLRTRISSPGGGGCRCLFMLLRRCLMHNRFTGRICGSNGWPSG